MDTGYKFRTGNETHLFLKEVCDLGWCESIY